MAEIKTGPSNAKYREGWERVFKRDYEQGELIQARCEVLRKGKGKHIRRGKGRGVKRG